MTTNEARNNAAGFLNVSRQLTDKSRRLVMIKKAREWRYVARFHGFRLPA